MKSRNILFFLLTLVISFTSCIKDDLEDCSLIIVVQDKNYNNIAEIDGLSPLAENLAMHNYVSTLSAWWLKMGANVNETRELNMSSDEKEYTVPSGFFADGSYDFVVSGNYLFTPQNAGNDFKYIDLHPQGQEGDDIYIGRDHFGIPLHKEETVVLNRTKGKLLLQFVDFPVSIASVRARVSGVYSNVDKDLNYIGSTTVTKSFIPTQPDTGDYFGMLLAPTNASGKTFLSLSLLGANGNTIYAINDIPIVISRNHLTLVRQRYLPGTNEWEISLFVDGEWEAIHSLIVEEN